MNKSRKILVVDDDQIVRIILSETLRQDGFKDVLLAVNGKEGLAMARGHKPDLVVTDIMMPEMDGFRLIQEIRNDPLLARTPIIVMTSREEMKELISMAEVQGFIPKPFNRETMLEAIKKVLAGLEVAEELRQAQAGEKSGAAKSKAVDAKKAEAHSPKKPAAGPVPLHEKIEKILEEGESAQGGVE